MESHRLYICLDVGSRYVKCWSKHVPADKQVHEVKAYCMQLEDGYPKIEQQLLLLPDDQGEDKLLWGHEVAEHIRLHPEDSLRVIDNLKLALCPEYADHEAVQHIRAVLGCPPGEAAIGNFRRLYTLILKKAWTGCVDFYDRISDVGFAKPADYWTSIATEVKITIPAMWDEDARSIMTQAAADAGFPDCRLYLEPLCAAAAEMTKLQAAGNLQYGDTMLLVDIGYFTIDFALARIDAPSPATKQPTMVAALGCHVVHTLAWSWFQSCKDLQEKGGIKRCRALLGDLPETNMRQQFFRYIEDNMKQPHPKDFPILINAIDKLKAGCTRSLTFLFPGDVLKDCLNTWASRITASTVSFTQDEQFQDLSVRYGHLTGGGSQNAFVLAKLKTTLASMRIDVRKPDSAEADMAVARGGLEQYPRNEADVLPEGYFYVTWDEPYHQTRHRDIQMKWTPDPFKRTRNLHATRPLTPHLATSSMEDPGKWYAVDRVQLVYQHDLAAPRESRCLVMEFPIDDDFNTELRFDIYFSRIAHKNGHALRSSDGAIKPEFTKFRVQLTDVDVDWSSYNFERYQNEGKSYFNVQGLIEVTGSAQQLHLTVKLLAPDQIIKYQESSSSRQQDDLDLCPDTTLEYEIITTVRSEIWHTHRSHKLSDGSHAPISVRDKDRYSARGGKKRRFDDRTTPSLPKRTKTKLRITAPGLTAGTQQRGGLDTTLQTQMSSDAALHCMKHDDRSDLSAANERRPASSKPSVSPARRIKSRASSSPDANGDESDDDTVPSEISHVEENAPNSVGQYRNRLWGRQIPGASNAGSDDRAMQRRRAGDAKSHRSLPASHAQNYAGGSLITPPDLRVSTRERTASAIEVDGILDKFADGTLFED